MNRAPMPYLIGVHSSLLTVSVNSTKNYNNVEFGALRECYSTKPTNKQSYQMQVVGETCVDVELQLPLTIATY